MAVGRAQERTSIPFSRIGVSRKQRICLEAALPITTFDTRNRFDLKSNQIKPNQSDLSRVFYDFEIRGTPGFGILFSMPAPIAHFPGRTGSANAKTAIASLLRMHTGAIRFAYYRPPRGEGK